jgi:hypothetical protein
MGTTLYSLIDVGILKAAGKSSSNQRQTASFTCPARPCLKAASRYIRRTPFPLSLLARGHDQQL